MGRLTKLDGLIVSFEEKEKLYRNLARLLRSETFNEAWAVASPLEKEKAFKYMESLDKRSLRSWANRILFDDIDQMGYRELRELGQRYGIRNYSRLMKQELSQRLREITDAKTNDMAN